MKIYSFSRTGLKLTSIAVLTLAVGLGFQNCSTQFSSGSPEAQASLNTPNRVIDDSDGTDPSLDASELKIELYATTALQEDCSVSGENYQFEILNASQDITMCMEYALDMPEGHPRRQESYRCNDINSQDKYVPPSSGWEHSATERKWSYRALANTVEQMPGDYRLYVRSGSSVAKSALLKVRRSGYANCGSQTAKYAVPEPVMPPSSGGGGGVVVPTPSPGQVVPGTNGACNPVGSTLIDVQTQMPHKAFPRTDYANTMTPTTIYSFAFRTPATSDLVTGQLVAAQLSSSRGNKWVIVSECRGDINRSNKAQSCAAFASESNVVTYIINKGGNYNSNLYCNLKPNTQYYANIVSPGVLTGQNVEGICDTVVNCGFSFLAK